MLKVGFARRGRGHGDLFWFIYYPVCPPAMYSVNIQSQRGMAEQKLKSATSTRRRACTTVKTGRCTCLYFPGIFL